LPQNSTLSITGLGILSGAGHGVDETMRLFAEDVPAPILSPALPVIALEARPEWRDGIADEDPLKVNLFALTAAREAIAQAGLTRDDLRTLRVGVCLGSTVGCSNFQPKFSLPYNTGEFPDPSPLLTHFKNNSAQWLSRALGLRGPTLLVSNACTSGADAIGIAANWLVRDLCDVVLCGGAEEILPQIYYGFKSMMLCSPELPRPFDKSRSGLTLGEGAGILVLEKTRTPRRPLARFLGYGARSDAYHPTAPDPSGHWLGVAVQEALGDDDISRVGFVNAHATATEHNDLAEGTWLREHAPHTTVVATKGYTGHTLAAAGAVEAVLTVLSLREGKLPVSRGFAESDPRIGLAPTTQIARGNFQTALSLSLGFGGTNSVLYLGRPS